MKVLDIFTGKYLFIGCQDDGTRGNNMVHNGTVYKNVGTCIQKPCFSPSTQIHIGVANYDETKDKIEIGDEVFLFD